jgi:hypothetical protein
MGIHHYSSRAIHPDRFLSNQRHKVVVEMGFGGVSDGCGEQF